MAFRRDQFSSSAVFLSMAVMGGMLFCGLRGGRAQVFVVGEKTAMADVSTDFHPTRVELPATPLTERDRLDLIRNLESEEGFAHRVLPLGTEITLQANGKLTPGGEDYKELLYKKGTSAQPGDRVAITKVTIKPDSIVLDIDNGPYLKHRFLRHVEINDMPVVPQDGEQVTGFRLTLVFEGGVPDISAPEVKALLDPLIDFGVKSSAQAYADTLPPFLKRAIDQHDVLVGMDRQMVLASMGAPESKVRELLPGSTDRQYEDWIYGKMPETVRFVRFVGDRVIQVRIAALGQPIVIHDKDEMQGYNNPDDIREIAEGDGQPGTGDGPAKAPPTILKPGEVAPGSSRRVLVPTSTPAGAGNSGSTSSGPDASAPNKGDAASANSQSSPSTPPATSTDKPTDPTVNTSATPNP